MIPTCTSYFKQELELRGNVWLKLLFLLDAKSLQVLEKFTIVGHQFSICIDQEKAVDMVHVLTGYFALNWQLAEYYNRCGEKTFLFASKQA